MTGSLRDAIVSKVTIGAIIVGAASGSLYIQEKSDQKADRVDQLAHELSDAASREAVDEAKSEVCFATYHGKCGPEYQKALKEDITDKNEVIGQLEDLGVPVDKDQLARDIKERENEYREVKRFEVSRPEIDRGIVGKTGGSALTQG